MTWDLSRRGTITLLGGLLTLAACGRADDHGVLRVGSQRGGTKAMMLASGVLDGIDYPIEWSEFPAAQHLLEALGAGAVDLGAVGDAPFLFAYQSGKAIRSVQATRYRPRNAGTAVLVREDSPITSLTELRGKKLATGRGSVGHLLALRALASAGVAPAEARIMFLPPGDAKAAFEAGAIDAWSTWSPYVGSAVLHGGARVLVDGRKLFDGYGFMAATEQAISEKRPILADFLARHARAESWANQNTDAYAAVLARETGLPLADARYFADREMAAVPTDAGLLRLQEGVLATFVDAGEIRAGRPIRAAFDTSFDGQIKS